MADDKKRNPFDQSETEDQQKGGEATATDVSDDVTEVEEDVTTETEETGTEDEENHTK